MDYPMFGRKRHLLLCDDQIPLRRKRFMDSDVHQDSAMTSGCGTWLHKGCVNRLKSNHLDAAKRLWELTLFWADTNSSAQKVLECLKTKRDDIFLDNSVNHKFLSFHKDIMEEYGIEDKQHSWAVIEKQEEIILYGPYYPNYSSGEHSEDIIIKQTQELLQEENVPEDWTVYVFTMNSPCLARNSNPCMLNLVQKAHDWWNMYAVKTCIGYMRSWGFKGNKENLFKDINYRQVELITQSADYDSYIDSVNKIDGFSPLCVTMFSVAKSVLGSEKLIFPLITSEEKQDQKSYFKSMNSILESKQEGEKKVLTNELNAVVEAADLLLGENRTFDEHLEKGKVFSLSYAFSSEVCEGLQEEMRVRFQHCWRETVQDRCAEFVREKLTDEFNQRTVQLFIDDIHTFTKAYLQIGKLKF